MYRTLKHVLACGGFFVLAACGGGGGDSAESTPPPPPAPSAFPLSSSQSFETLAVTRILNGSDEAHVLLSNPPPHVRVSYDASAGTYTVSDDVASATLNDTCCHSTSGLFDVYTKNQATVTDQLKVYGNARAGGPQVGAPFQLTYLSFAVWTHGDLVTGDSRKSHILFGYPTATSSMPTTGSASYQTMVNATMFEGGPGYPNNNSDVDGTATFTATFATGAINTELSLARQGGQSLGVYTGTGTINSGNQFIGTFTSTNPYFSDGNFQGGFFGPSAVEMGYNFEIFNFNPDPYAGASVLPQNTYITGSVIGRKQ